MVCAEKGRGYRATSSVTIGQRFFFTLLLSSTSIDTWMIGHSISLGPALQPFLDLENLNTRAHLYLPSTADHSPHTFKSPLSSTSVLGPFRDVPSTFNPRKSIERKDQPARYWIWPRPMTDCNSLFTGLSSTKLAIGFLWDKVSANSRGWKLSADHWLASRLVYCDGE